MSQLGLLGGDRPAYRMMATGRDGGASIGRLTWDEAIDAAHLAMERGAASVEVIDDRGRVIATGKDGWLTGEHAPETA